jgi:hypothetical protein
MHIAVRGQARAYVSAPARATGARRTWLRFDRPRAAHFRSVVRDAAHGPRKFSGFLDGARWHVNCTASPRRLLLPILLPSEEEGAMPNGYEVMTEFSPETEQFEDEASAMAGRGRSGRWIRAGRNIIVVNA